MDNSGASISLDRVRFGYGETRVQFDLAVNGGAIVAICGPSGSGKTTLLNLIAGFEFPVSGHVRINDADVSKLPPSQRPVSFLFQEHNLFSHLTVRDNVALGISPSLHVSKLDEARIAESLERVGMADKSMRLPEQLSGGERQRAALARVLVQNNPVLLMDEPFASLGPSLRMEMTELVGLLHRAREMTILLVTHHPAEIASIAPQLCFVEAGQIRALGPIDALLSDKAPGSVRSYLGGDSQIR